VEVVDQQERYEGQENQKDCHKSPLRKGRRFLPLSVSGPLAVFRKGNRRTKVESVERLELRDCFRLSNQWLGRECEEKCIGLFDETLNSMEMRTATRERLIVFVFAAYRNERPAIAEG
jgi:hypothetical protein